MSTKSNTKNIGIYSMQFLIKSKELACSKICPKEIQTLDFKISLVDNKDLLKKWVRGKTHPIKKQVNQWDNNPPDVKRLLSILNRLSEENYDKLVVETKTFNYSDPEVMKVMFNKIIAEPFYSELYAKFCKDLVHLHSILNEFCIVEFDKNKHKNLSIFIGELYKANVLLNISIFVDTLKNDLSEVNLEILCKLICTIGSKNIMFKDLISYLNSIKINYSKRYQWIIMDVVDHRPPPKILKNFSLKN